jgi:hypothetical protein
MASAPQLRFIEPRLSERLFDLPNQINPINQGGDFQVDRNGLPSLATIIFPADAALIRKGRNLYKQVSVGSG